MLRRDRIGAGLTLLVTAAVAIAVQPVQMKEAVRATTENPGSVVNYVMASPRAFLMHAPLGGTDEVVTTGAAEDFPRLDGEIEVPVGTRVISSLSPETEVVWQDATYGTMETTLTVQWFEAVTPYDGDECAAEGLSDEPVAPGNAKPGKEGSEEVVSCPWITIAADGARDTRNGPSLGYTKVGVPVTFRQPGTYCVRGTASTSARAWSPGPLEPSQDRSAKGQEAPAEEPAAPPVLDTDVVCVTVHTTDRPNPGNKPQRATNDPDATHMKPMPSIGNTKALHPDKDNSKGSGAPKVISPGAFLGTQVLGLGIPS